MGKAGKFFILPMAILFAAVLALLPSLALAQVSVTAPGAAVKQGDNVDLDFDAGGYSNMVIELSYDGGTNWDAPPVYDGLVADAANPLNWTVPVSGVTSTHCLLKITCDSGGAPASSTSAEFTIDNDAPTGTSIAINGGAANTTTPNVTLTLSATDADSDVAKMSFSDDNLTWSAPEAYAGSKAYTLPGADGVKTVYVKFLDGAGNESAPVSAQITLDTDAPTVAISAPSAGLTRGGPIAYTVTYSGADTITLADLDVILNKTGTATGTVSITGADATTRTVQISGITGDGALGISIPAATAVDTAGNSALGAGPSATFIVDNTAPTFAVTGVTTSPAKQGASVSITFTASEALDGTNPAVTVNTHPASYVSNTGLDYTYTYTIQASDADGPATISMSGTDTAGNLGTSTDNTQLVVDKTAPTFAVTGVTTSPAKQGASVSIAFTASKTLNGTNPAVTVNTHPASYVSNTGLDYTYTYTIQASDADGPATISMSGTDTAGNLGTSTDNTQLVVDKTAPVFDLGSPSADPATDPDNWTSASSITVYFAATDAGSGIARYELALDNGAYSTRTTGYVLDVSAIPDGIHTVHVKAIDNVGNEYTKDINIYLDKTPPDIASVAPDQTAGGTVFDYVMWNNRGCSYALDWNAHDGKSGVRSVVVEYWHGTSWTNVPVVGTAGGSVSAPSAEGDDYVFRIKVTDKANLSKTYTTDVFAVYDFDDLVPTVKMTSPPNGVFFLQGMAIPVKVTVTMPVFHDPRTPTKAYVLPEGNWLEASQGALALKAYTKYVRPKPDKVAEHAFWVGRPLSVISTGNKTDTWLNGKNNKVNDVLKPKKVNPEPTHPQGWTGLQDFQATLEWAATITLQRGYAVPNYVYQLELDRTRVFANGGSLNGTNLGKQPAPTGTALTDYGNEPLAHNSLGLELPWTSSVFSDMNFARFYIK